jgi:hypothetical protein
MSASYCWALILDGLHALVRPGSTEHPETPALLAALTNIAGPVPPHG